MTKRAILIIQIFLSCTLVLNAQSKKEIKDTIYNDITLFSFEDSIKAVHFKNVTFNAMPHLDFLKLDTLLFTNCIFRKAITISTLQTNIIEFDDCSFKNNCENKCLDDNCKIYFTKIDTLPSRLNKLVFIGSAPTKIIFNNRIFMDTLDFWEVKELTTDIAIQGFIPIMKNDKDSKTTIRIYPDIADRYQFDYSKYKLDIPNNYFVCLDNIIPITYSDSIRLYSKLLECQKRNYFMEGVEKADIDLHEARLRHYNHLDDRLSKIIWNYTYDKEKIFLWSLILFGICYIINLVFLKRLTTEVFVIDKITERINKFSPYYYSLFKSSWNRIVLTFFYTSIVFWGIKLDVDKFRFQYNFWTVYIFITYLIGLVCTFFVGSYIYLKLT